jgi:hypothetical protein
VKQRIIFLAIGVFALALFGEAMAGPLEDGEAETRGLRDGGVALASVG